MFLFESVDLNSERNARLSFLDFARDFERSYFRQRGQQPSLMTSESAINLKVGAITCSLKTFLLGRGNAAVRNLIRCAFDCHLPRMKLLGH